MEWQEIAKTVLLAALCVGALRLVHVLAKSVHDTMDEQIQREAYLKVMKNWQDEMMEQQEAVLKLREMLREEEKKIAEYECAVQGLHEQSLNVLREAEKSLTNQDRDNATSGGNEDGSNGNPE